MSETFFSMTAEMQRAIDKALKRLSCRERNCIIMYFGLGDRDALDYTEIGKTFNCGRVRAEQIIKCGLKKLAHFQETWNLYSFLESNDEETYLVDENETKHFRRVKIKQGWAMSRIEVVNKLGISESAFSNWVRYGKFPKPDLEHKQWSRALVSAWIKLNPNPKNKALRPEVNKDWRRCIRPTSPISDDVDHSKLYTSKTVAQLLCIKPARVLCWVRKKRFPKPTKHPKCSLYIWKKFVVDRWIEKHRNELMDAID
jgi:predicted DNA-binding transcriptional regulator AlpA